MILMSPYYLLFLFAISFISNATPFFGSPYTVIATTILLSLGINAENFLEAVLITGFGAATAKSVMYALGYGVGSKLKSNRNVQFFHRVMRGRSLYLTVFITAILPFFPFDDFVFLMGGAGRAPLLKMLLVTLASKVAKSCIEIGLEALGLIQVGRFTDVSPVILGVISSVVFAVLGVVLFKLDWEGLYQKADKYLRALSDGGQ